MGGDLHELVDAGQVGAVFAWIAILLPPLCVVCGWWHGSRRNNRRQSTLYGLMIGLFGPANWVMWRVYNAITDATGLDTVRNLVINAILFLIVGAVAGIGIGIAIRRIQGPTEGVPPPDNSA